MKAAVDAWSEPVMDLQPLAATCQACSIPQDEYHEPVLEAAQARWALRTVAERLQVVRAARHAIAHKAERFAAAVSPTLHRNAAETLITEVLPLLDALRFLERSAQRLLAPRRLGLAGRPLWLAGVSSEVQRVPLGHVLVIAPANFPLLLAGVQAAQALVAGNAVTWKPGEGGEAVALMFARAFREAGLPRAVLSVTGEGVQDAESALAQHPDKVIFTGSAATGQKVLAGLAEQLTPATMELSGADAVVVLPGADLPLVARAVAFGLRLNGAAVCMSPRRLFAAPTELAALRPLLEQALATIGPVRLAGSTGAQLQQRVHEAVQAGAQLIGAVEPSAQRPLLVRNARPEMAIAQSDLFAPVLSLIEVASPLHVPAAVHRCPYALTAAVFGPVAEARALGEQLRVGTVVINDLIAPTVDPRVPFGGRGKSGFGVTRGAEGLLEMTAVRTVLIRKGGSGRQYSPVGAGEQTLFAGLIRTMHGGTPGERWRALMQVARAGRQRAAAEQKTS